MFEIALILFVITYGLLFAFSRFRPVIAVTSALVYIILNVIGLEQAWSAIDWNVILMLFGIMGLVSLFIESRMPLRIADGIFKRAPNAKLAIVYLAVFSGLVSALVDNVATVIIVVPIALNICKKAGISPVPAVIAISLASNLQGAATMVGDASAILFASHLDMTFFDFFFYDGKAGLFWVVQAAFLVFSIILLLLFRKQTHPLPPDPDQEHIKVDSYYPSVLLATLIIALISVSFIPDKPDLTSGFVCVVMYAIGILIELCVRKRPASIKASLRQIDYGTLMLLASLFVIIAAVAEVGVIDIVGSVFAGLGGNSIFALYTAIVVISMICAAIIDNIPYVAMMLPVIATVSSSLAVDPLILYYGLLVGSTIGGNLSPIGASANITSVGILAQNGYPVSLKEYLKISVPTTILSLFTAYVLIWFLFI